MGNIIRSAPYYSAYFFKAKPAMFECVCCCCNIKKPHTDTQTSTIFHYCMRMYCMYVCVCVGKYIKYACVVLPTSISQV